MTGASTIHISKHAIIRFRDRCDNVPENIEQTIRNYMAQAKEEYLGYGTAVRIISNGFKPARYFTFKTWRFVTDEGCTIVMTCEKILVKAKKKQRFKELSRYGKQKV